MVRRAVAAPATGFVVQVPRRPACLAHTERQVRTARVERQATCGPYILSDLRYGDGPLYARYGAFTKRHCRNGEDELVPAITDASGKLVPDVRQPVFSVPPWVTLPAFLTPHLILVLADAPSLVRHGVSAGQIVGAVSYIGGALQTALYTLTRGIGGSGIRLATTLQRITEASGAAPGLPPRDEPGAPPGALRAAPAAGQIRLAGRPLPEVPAAELPRYRVLIPQQAYVFAGTLGENLAYLAPDARRADIAASAEAVGLEPLVARLGGYGADVSPAALSAGERQLIALARAHLSAAKLAILDEATCHLHAAAAERAERAFADRPGTLIVIAHRMSSALRADRVLVLDGTRPQFGEHEALLASSPLYQDLVGQWHGNGLALNDACGSTLLGD